MVLLKTNMSGLQEILAVVFSDRKIVIRAKEQFCNRYPQLPGIPTPGCAECGLGESYGKSYDQQRDYVTLDGDFRAFQQKAREGAVSITLLGGEVIQDVVTKTPWPRLNELSLRYGINTNIIRQLLFFREEIGKPINEGTPMKMWERDALLPTAMIASLGMLPHITSNFDIFRQDQEESSKEEIITQLKIAGLKGFNVSWHTKPKTTLEQNRRYFEDLVSAIKYSERVIHIPTILTRVFRGFEADPDIFLWQREVANHYITNDISPAEIHGQERNTVFYGSNQELQPTQEEVETLGLFHLLNAMAGDQPRVKTVFQAIFEGVLAKTGWRCNPDKEHFELIDTTPEGIRSNVCSEVRGQAVRLFPEDKSSRMQERAGLIHQLCPACLSRCYTYFEWRDFQKDPLHLWHYTQAAGKIWRQMYGRDRPFRHLVMKAEDYLNPDLLERALQFRFRYFSQKLADPQVVSMLQRSGIDPKEPLLRYYHEAVNPDDSIYKLQQCFQDLPEFADENSLQSRVMRQVARLKHTDPQAAPIPWKYVWVLRKENQHDLNYHLVRTIAVIDGKEESQLSHQGTILAKILNLLFPRISYSFLNNQAWYN